MLEELGRLIEFIQNEYDKVSDEWKEYNNIYDNVNQRSIQVKDIEESNNILGMILYYREFLNSKNLLLQDKVKKQEFKNEVNVRVKTKNSTEYKIKNYMSSKHEFGKVPMNKCFNDLCGLRIIFNTSVSYEEIKKYVMEKFGNSLKCYNATKGDYIATHIYFKKDNFNFVWELQIWNKENKDRNIISHEKYKQGYAKWEKDNKGGKI